MCCSLEEFKFAKSLQPGDHLCKNPAVKNFEHCSNAENREVAQRQAVQYAQDALQHRDLIGQVQSGRAGFRLGDSWKAWGKTTLPKRRQMVTSFEETR